MGSKKNNNLYSDQTSSNNQFSYANHEIRSIPNSRGEISTAQNNRSMNKERYDLNAYERFSSKDSEHSIINDNKLFLGILLFINPSQINLKHRAQYTQNCLFPQAECKN